VLVTNWNSLTFTPTSTTLQLSSTSFVHGTPVTVNVSVESATQGDKPQGGVSILTNSPAPAKQSVDVLTLSNGSASGSINSLPGGTYQVWADYGGDGVNGSSNSSPVSITVTPEPSNVSIHATQTMYSAPYNPAAACTPAVGSYEEAVANGASVPLSTPLWLTVQPFGTSSNVATGSVTFTFDGQPTSVPLNVSGIATWITPMTASVGTHTVIATYSGDASYAPGTSSSFTYTVQQDSISPFVLMNSSIVSSGANCNTGAPCNAYAGDNYPVQVWLFGGVCQLMTGTVTVTLGSQTQTVALSPEGFPAGEILTGVTIFPNVQAGTYQLTGTYSGDANYPGSTKGPYTIIVAPSAGPLIPTTVTASANPSVIQYFEAANVVFTATVTGGAGSNGPPTGTIDIYRDGENSFSISLTPSGPNAATGSYSIPNYNHDFYFGLNQFVAVYGGDPTYQGSVSAAMQVSAVDAGVIPDFIMAPQFAQIAVASGGSANVGINLAPQNEFSGSVALSCTPSSSQITCSLNPSTVAVNGQTTATLTITAAAKTSGAATPMLPSRSGWVMATGMLAFGLIFVGGQARRKLRQSSLPGFCLFAAMLTTSCGGGGASTISTVTISQSSPPPTLVTYSVVVTGTANGVTHNAKVIVAIQ
jgi:hypothetical protein